MREISSRTGLSLNLWYKLRVDITQKSIHLSLVQLIQEIIRLMFRMKIISVILLFGIVPVSAQSPLPTLSFTKGESLKYSANQTVTVTETAKDVNVKTVFTSNHTITLNVTSVSAGKAKMSIKPSGITTKATITGLPKDAEKDKANIEKQAAEAFKQEISTSSRSQTVDIRGKTEYHIDVGDGKTLNIENGAYFFLVLPNKAIKAGDKWTADVSSPDPRDNSKMKVNYTLKNITTQNNQQIYNIEISFADSKSHKQQDVTLSGSIRVTGNILYNFTTKKLNEVNMTRTVTETATSSKGEKAQRTIVTNTKIKRS